MPAGTFETAQMACEERMALGRGQPCGDRDCSSSGLLIRKVMTLAAA
jgi:hypothetical protein